MPFRGERQFETIEEKETVGHQIESKIGEFIAGSFDCVENIEYTSHNGPNDKKGIDMVVTFEGGRKMAIDVTADMGLRVEEKIKSMRRNPLVGIGEERNTEGEVSVEKSRTLIPRGLIRVDGAKWAEYNIENVGDEVLVYMPDRTRIQEEKDILNQLLRQIEYFSKEDGEYKKAAEKIKEMLQEALEEVEKIEKEFN